MGGGTKIEVREKKKVGKKDKLIQEMKNLNLGKVDERRRKRRRPPPPPFSDFSDSSNSSDSDSDYELSYYRHGNNRWEVSPPFSDSDSEFDSSDDLISSDNDDESDLECHHRGRHGHKGRGRHGHGRHGHGKHGRGHHGGRHRRHRRHGHCWPPHRRGGHHHGKHRRRWPSRGDSSSSDSDSSSNYHGKIAIWDSDQDIGCHHHGHGGRGHRGRGRHGGRGHRGHGGHGRRGRHGRHGGHCPHHHGRHHHHHRRHWPPHRHGRHHPWDEKSDSDQNSDFNVMKGDEPMEKLQLANSGFETIENLQQQYHKGKKHTPNVYEEAYGMGEVISEDTKNEKKYIISLDVTGIPRKHINVRFVDNFVIVEGKVLHEDKFGSIQRQFMRKIALPEGTQANDVFCEFSSDNGTIRIVAKKKKSPPPSETSDSIAIIDAE